MQVLIALLTVLSPIILKLIDRLFPEQITKNRDWEFGKRNKRRLMETIKRRSECSPKSKTSSPG